MTDRLPSATPQQRAALLARFFEPWTARAACNTKTGIPGQLWQPMFLDDVASKPDPDDYEWPRRVKDAMRVCASCPVRRPCLETSFAESGDHLRQFGVRGGVPGRVREALGFRECRNCRGRGYVTAFTFDGVKIRFRAFEWVYQGSDPDEPKRERAKGFKCVECKGTGKVEARNRVKACEQWFSSFIRRQRWVVPNAKEKAS